MGDKKRKVLSIIGSPSTETSNTRALVKHMVASIGESCCELSHRKAPGKEKNSTRGI